jgi:hypothetical protein
MPVGVPFSRFGAFQRRMSKSASDPKRTLHPFNQPRALEEGLQRGARALTWPLSGSFYATRFIPGGCHVPSPGGRIEGGSVFGQYSRNTK